MKAVHKLLQLLIVLFFSTIMLAQSGNVFDNLSMKSTIPDSERNYAVYLLPDYEISERSYTVLYLLHGGGDDQTGWVQFVEVLHIADKAIRECIAKPMIIVMPDASTGQKGFFNSVKGDFLYEDFFFEEFMSYIEKNAGLMVKNNIRNDASQKKYTALT